MAEEKPIIVIKKKGGHGGHHGGAWKVAYADFVTAMMAFFMVMWLINTADAPTRKSIASYFRRPGLFETGSGSPLLIGHAGILQDAGSPPVKKNKEKRFAAGDSQTALKKKSGTLDEELGGRVHGESASAAEDLEDEYDIGSTPTPVPTPTPMPVGGYGIDIKQLEKAAAQIQQQIAASPELKDLLGVVDVKVDADGLNIEIMDTEKASMFALGSARIESEAEAAFEKIGAILSKLPNSVDIVGHTDARPYSARRGGYSNWELSAERANTARRMLEKAGVSPERITSVLGRADRELKNPADPLAASNRRITLRMRFPISRSIDLSKETSALDDLPADPQPAPKQDAAASHSLTPQEILSQQKKTKPPTIKLPDQPTQSANPDYMQRDKIFSNNPVIGPPLPFSNF